MKKFRVGDEVQIYYTEVRASLPYLGMCGIVKGKENHYAVTYPEPNEAYGYLVLMENGEYLVAPREFLRDAPKDPEDLNVKVRWDDCVWQPRIIREE